MDTSSAATFPMAVSRQGNLKKRASQPAFSGASAVALEQATHVAEKPVAIQKPENFEKITAKVVHDAAQNVHSVEMKAVRQGQVVYGRMENNIREMTRLVLVNFLPLFAAMKLPLSFTVLGAITAVFAGFFVRLANKLGQRIGRHVDPSNLTPVLKGFHKLHDVLNPSMTAQEIERFRKAAPEAKKAFLQELQNRDHTDKVNRVLSDLAASSKLPKLLSFIRQERFQKWASEQFRFNPNSWVGRTLNQSINNKTLMKNQAFSDFANSKTFLGAMGSGARHVGNGFITFRVMPKIGRMIDGIADSSACPGFLKPLFRWLGTLFKNSFIAQSAWDAARIYTRPKNQINVS